MTHIKKNFIIDFDSTFVSTESLQELAKRSLRNDPHKLDILTEITELVHKAMNGSISLEESLDRRIALIHATKNDIQSILPFLRRHVTPSVKHNKHFFQQYADQIYIISGGFKECIDPVAQAYGISSDHIFANTFTYDEDGLITGIDRDNPLSRSGGKSTVVKQLNLKNEIVVIGDGITDWEIARDIPNTTFYAFTENVTRPEVVKVADYIVPSFDEFLFQLKIPASVSYPKNRIKVLVLEKIHQVAVDRFIEEGYEVEALGKALSEEELIKKIPNVSILCIRSKTKVSRNVIDHAKKLQVIGTFSIGTDQIDTNAASESGICVFNAPYSNTRSVVELAFGEMIMLARRVFERSTEMHQGKWNKSADRSHELRGKVLGIIGYGKIGSQLSILAEALGMSVCYFNRSETLQIGNATKCYSLEELLKKSDVITIHVDGRKENTNMISKKQFQVMKPGVLFMNLSRGNIVDISALRWAIDKGVVAGAAIDVFPKEPASNTDPFESELIGLNNVILTPHIGGSTIEAQVDIAHFVANQIIHYINNGSTQLSVNFPNLKLPEVKNYSRFIHIHQNKPGVLAKINELLSKNKINIEGQYLQTNNNIGYAIIDAETTYSKEIINDLRAIPETIKVRVLY